MKLSIIVPTFNESENVEELEREIRAAIDSRFNYEVIFIDDSSDDTPIVLRRLAEQHPSVRFEHRTHERGLGTAVVRGFGLATGDVLTVMDSDLQHPPSMLVQMMAEIQSGADMVIPSRFVPGGSDGGLSLHRKIISAGARYLGKITLRSLREISDPTSGFFMFRRSGISGAKLQPIGWKILIEVLVRGQFSHIVEPPYQFKSRNAGESKMSLREQWNYVRHLLKLVVVSPVDRRFYLFTLVGLSGVLINLLIYDGLVKLGFAVPLSGLVSAVCAMISNFILNDSLTWSDVRTSSRPKRALKYGMTSLLGIFINVLVLDLMYRRLHVHYLLANLVGIAAATIFNYVVNNKWTWASRKLDSTPGPNRAA